MTHTRPQRLLALDVMRGITIAGMILVNNPGSWGSIYAPLRHAPWHGLTPTDLVFPFFMFIMGVSTCFSLSKGGFTPTRPTVAKILRRSVLIILIGWALAWFGMFLRGMANPEMSATDAIFNFNRIRLPGVLPRLGVCYCAAALLTVWLSKRALTWTVGIFLALYTIILLAGDGLSFSADNIIAVIDSKLLGHAHMYSDTIDGVTLKFDPEGLLSTLPSIAHCLIGVLCGMMIVDNADTRIRALDLFVVGTALTFAGFLLSYGMPINKKIWSPTFVLTTCGLASLLLALLIWVIDIKGHKRWCAFFNVYGVNPLFLFVLAGVLSIVTGVIKVPYSGVESGMASIHVWLYKGVLMPMAGGDATLASLFHALIFILITWLAGLWLYRRKIYIKI